MIILILKILSAISLLPFLFIVFVSVMIFLRLERARVERGIPSWDKLALVGENGSVQPASDLIKQLKKRTLGLASAIGVIIMGFVIPFFSPESIKNIDMYYYFTFGIGFGGGWLLANGCVHYGNLVSWNLMGTKPPSGVNDGH